MKKIPLLLAVITLMWSYNSNPNKSSELKDSTQAVADIEKSGGVAKFADLKSLNGIEEGAARGMIKYFFDHKADFKNPKPKSIWFKKEIIAEIVKVLDSNANIDGVRLYFGGYATSKLSFIWVATTSNGPDTSKPYQSKMLHKDLYLDESKYNLYNIGSIVGDVCDTITGGGTRLYRPGTSGTIGANCTWLPNNVTISYAEQMVAAFQRPHEMNTDGEWFDRSVFKAIDSDKGNYNGVRVYFARHPTGANLPFNSDRDAFLIATTGTDPKYPNDITDIFDCNVNKLYNELFKKQFVDKIGLPPVDNGELCPNHCDK